MLYIYSMHAVYIQHASVYVYIHLHLCMCPFINVHIHLHPDPTHPPAPDPTHAPPTHPSKPTGMTSTTMATRTRGVLAGILPAQQHIPQSRSRCGDASGTTGWHPLAWGISTKSTLRSTRCTPSIRHWVFTTRRASTTRNFLSSSVFHFYLHF